MIPAASGWGIRFGECSCGSTGGCPVCRPRHLAESLEVIVPIGAKNVLNDV